MSIDSDTLTTINLVILALWLLALWLFVVNLKLNKLNNKFIDKTKKENGNESR